MLLLTLLVNTIFSAYIPKLNLVFFDTLWKYFHCSVSNSTCKRKTNFSAKLKCSDNVVIGLFSNVISMELSGLQLSYACTWSEFDIVYYFINLHFSNFSLFYHYWWITVIIIYSSLFTITVVRYNMKIPWLINLKVAKNS